MTCPRIRALVLAAASAAAAGCASSTAALRQELAMSNTQTVLAFQETIYNKHEVREGFEHYVGPTYREHDPRIADGKQAAIRALTQLVTHFPNSHVTVRRTIAQGNLVAVHLLWTPQSESPGGTVRVDIYRLEGGRIVEHWNVAQEVPAGAAGDN